MKYLSNRTFFSKLHQFIHRYANSLEGTMKPEFDLISMFTCSGLKCIAFSFQLEHANGKEKICKSRGNEGPLGLRSYLKRRSFSEQPPFQYQINLKYVLYICQLVRLINADKIYFLIFFSDKTRSLRFKLVFSLIYFHADLKHSFQSLLR